MSIVNPLPRGKTAAELHPIYDGLSKKFGKTPNTFGLMAHWPEVLAKFLPFYSAVMEGSTVEVCYKELACLKTALINIRQESRSHNLFEQHRSSNPLMQAYFAFGIATTVDLAARM
jgi:hypothetical protein